MSQPYYGSAPQEQPGGASAYHMQNQSYAPPQYGQPMPSYSPQEDKGSFREAFKIDRPKWNDLWAGILVGPSVSKLGAAQRLTPT